jgi:hypothetical protein
MVRESFKRKLTAILSADTAGYSRLMGEDEEDLEEKKETKRTASLLPPEKEAEKAVKITQPSEPLKSDHAIEIAVFPWRLNIMAKSAYADTRSTETLTVAGLNQVLNEYQLVVPKFSYLNNI